MTIAGSGARWRWAERLGLLWALGLPVCTLTLFLLYLLGVPAALAPWLALPPTIAAGYGLWQLRGRASQGATTRLAWAGGANHAAANPAQRRWRTPRLQELLTVLPALWAVLVVLQRALAAPLSAWDAWSLWGFKAQMFAQGNPPLSYFRDATTLHTHPDYPLNLPLALALPLRLPTPLGLEVAALLDPLSLVALLLLLYAGLSRLYGSLVAALAVTILTALPTLLAQAAGGDADLPLALYSGGAALYLLLWWRQRQPLDLALMGGLAGGAIWTKKEGVALAALLLLAWVLPELCRRDRSWRALARAVVSVAAAVAALSLPWLLFSAVVHPLGRDFLPLTPGVFLAHLGRLPQIAEMCALQLLDLHNWSLLWPVLVALIAVSWRRLPPHVWSLLALLGAQLSVYLLAFVFSDWQPYTAHVQTALVRLLLQATPLALLTAVSAAVDRAPIRAATHAAVAWDHAA